MKKSSILILAGVVAVSFLAGVFIATQIGIIPSSASAYPNSTELSTGVLNSIVGGMDLDVDFEGAVSELNIELFGVNGESSQDVINWYNYKNTQDGWSIYRDEHDSGHGWNAYLYAWTKGTSGRVVLAVDGSIVEGYTDYDTVIITSHAPLWVYERYFT